MKRPKKGVESDHQENWTLIPQTTKLLKFASDLKFWGLKFKPTRMLLFTSSYLTSYDSGPPIIRVEHKKQCHLHKITCGMICSNVGAIVRSALISHAHQLQFKCHMKYRQDNYINSLHSTFKFEHKISRVKWFGVMHANVVPHDKHTRFLIYHVWNTKMSHVC